MNIKAEYHWGYGWSAIDVDTHVYESDSNGWVTSSPEGYGNTEDEAVEDLLDQIKVTASGIASLDRRSPSSGEDGWRSLNVWKIN